jgi:hypothetical protein
MSHPGNKRERFLIGDRKGQRRVVGHCIYKTKGDRQEYLDVASKRRRSTTTLCSCAMCGNPRRLRGEITMQERRHGIDTKNVFEE